MPPEIGRRQQSEREDSMCMEGHSARCENALSDLSGTSSKVSVVIPLYNKRPYIERTIRSVLSQTIQDFEIVVVDDGSQDGGADIVRAIDDRRIRLISQENRGVSAARNRGVHEATSDFIAFLDADDEWKPTFLETILRLRMRYPGAGIYATDRLNCRPDGRTKACRYIRIPPPPWEGLLPGYFITAGSSDQPICSSVIGIPKQVLEEVGGFPVGVRIGEDLITWFNIALKYPIAFSREIGAVYHMEAENRTDKQARDKTWRLNLITRIEEAIRNGEVPVEKINEVQEYLAVYQIGMAWHYIRSGRTGEARTILSRCRTELLKKDRRVMYFRTFLPAPFR